VSTDCYLVVDGNKLSTQYKLTPFDERSRYNPKLDIYNLIGDEYETLATGDKIIKNYGITDIRNYVKEIVLLDFNVDANIGEDPELYSDISNEIGKNYESTQDIKEYIESTYNIPVKIIKYKK
jgi:hypothetical protein